MRTTIRLLASIAIAAAFGPACDRPAVAPGLDIDCQPGNNAYPACVPGSISGTVTYQGKRRGDVILLLFPSSALPPPDGTGTNAQALAKILSAQMFGSDQDGLGPFSSNYVFSQVPPGSYQIRAFVDSSGSFEPFFDFAQQPHAGDPVGGHVTFDANGVPHLADITVTAATTLSGVTVAIGQELPFDPPSFTVAEAVAGAGDNASTPVVTLPSTMDRPQFLHLNALNLKVPHATFTNAKFAVQLQLNAAGKPAITDGDGFFDAFPQVLLKQIDQVNADGTRSNVDSVHAAIIPAKLNSLPLLPLLMQDPANTLVGADSVSIAVLPFAVNFLPTPQGERQRFQPLPSIPPGAYQLIVIEKSGQLWTLPNSLGATVPSQNAHVELAVTDLPRGIIKGTVRYPSPGAAGVIPPGNITVQAYRVDPANQPPPLGTALPVRVQIVRAATVIGEPAGCSYTAKAGAPQCTGFNAPFQIEGLSPGNYLVQALSDTGGTFAPFVLLQTPGKGSLLGAHFDATGHLAPVAVADNTVTADVQLVQVPGQDPQGNGLALDPPAFVVDDSAGPAQLAQDARGTTRLKLKAQPITFPIGSGAAASTQFTVSLVRDSAGNTVDADGDGLPDVWPKIFVVKLDDTDATGLTPAKQTVVIPAAVDPTPYLPRLLASAAPVLTKTVSVILRPTGVDVTNPAAPARLIAMPAGHYKIVVMNQTGQVWQIPNEAGSAALDPRAVALVDTASQSKAFMVLPPQGSVATGSIQGAIRGIPTGTKFAGAYVFAFDTRNPPPPVGTGTPISADFHSPLEAASDGSIAFTLRGLPAAAYVITAIVDTRGDFAVAPQLFAAAPGEGVIAGKFAPVVVGSGAVTQDVTVDPSRPMPPRPSFQITQGPIVQYPVVGPGPVVTSDVSSIVIDPLVPQRLSLHAQSILTGALAYKQEADPAFFPVSYQGCNAAGVAIDANFDNLPDIYPKILVVRLADSDPTGLTIDPRNIAIPAAVDPTPFLAELGACATSMPIIKSDLSVLLSPLAVTVSVDGSQSLGPVPAGRYGVILMSSTGQTWRVPNELQPALLDPSVQAMVLPQKPATQGVGLAIAGTPQPDGVITGSVSLSGFTSATIGNLVIAAYAANDPPPPFGTGRPVAATQIPRGFLPPAGVGYTLPLSPAAASAGPLLVTALLDRSNRFSPFLSYLGTPPIGAQASFYTTNGQLPSAVILGSGNSAAGINMSIAASPAAQLPYERPMFAVDPASLTGCPVALQQPAGTQCTVFNVYTAPTAPAAQLKLVPARPSGVPYGVGAAPGSVPAFHPLVTSLPAPGFGAGYNVQASSDSAAAHLANGAFKVTTQVLFSPLFTPGPSTCAPVAVIDLANTQVSGGGSLCSALINSPDANCTTTTGAGVALRQADPTGNPGFFPPEVTALQALVPANLCVRLSDKSVQLGTAPTAGAYRVSVVEFTGQSWSIPNEMAQPQGLPSTVVGSQSSLFVVQ